MKPSRIPRRPLAAAAGAAIVALSAGLAGSAPGTGGPSAESATRAAAVAGAAADRAAPRRAKIKVAQTRFGRVIVDRRGEALYMFDKERAGTPRCYGQCARLWPPLRTRLRPRALGAARKRLIGTTRRRGGSKQVTYRGHPLYYYRHDSPGTILCHKVHEFGGLWLVVKRNGHPAD